MKISTHERTASVRRGLRALGLGTALSLGMGLGLGPAMAQAATAATAGTSTPADGNQPMNLRMNTEPLQPTQSAVGAGQAPHNAAAIGAVPPSAAPAAAGAQGTPADAGEARYTIRRDPAALDSLATVDAEYKIAPNDLLQFDVFGVPDMAREVRVNMGGLVSLPLIGPVRLAGMTGQQAEAMIAAKYAEKYLQDPQVSIFIKEFTTQRITLEGALLKPGIYPVTGRLTLLRALALAGGYAQYADLKEIMVYRFAADGERQTMKFDLEKVRNGEQMDPEVLADDVIVVKRDAQRTALRDSLFRDVIDTLNPFAK